MAGLAPTAGVAIDLSEGGAFLETGAALPLQLLVQVLLAPKGRRALTLPGKVLRVGYNDKSVRHDELDHLVVRVAGLAVKFDGIEKGVLGELEGYLKTLDEL